MGQSSSQLDNQRTSRQIANFYHICNIIPDTPEHHHQIWSPDSDASIPTQKESNCTHTHTKRKVHVHKPRRKSRPSFAKHNSSSDEASTHTNAFQSNRFATSATDYTTDDESDVFSTDRWKSSRSKRKNSSSKPTSTTNDVTFPTLLDRRYDLDVAPSMINMDLRFNGAYMVVNSIYNILTCKFGYQHMLSVQMLFWMAIHKYYQIQSINVQTNYKLSLSTLLDVVKQMSLCSEREMSIYTDVAKKHGEHVSLDASSTSRNTLTHTFPITSLVSKQMYQTPFYHMQYYYVSKDEHILKSALLNDHLILANLTLFSNFLSSRGGVVHFPNSTDTSAGMIVVTILGYQNDTWIVRFPFGIHWGDQGVGYVSFEYFDRYNRDRWLIDIDECSEPPQYVTQRQKEQVSENSELLAAHMGTSYHTQSQSTNANVETVAFAKAAKSTGNTYRARRRIV